MILINDLNLKELVESKGFSQNGIYKRTKISRKTLWRYWNDQSCHHIDGHGISTDRLYKILNVLDMRLVIMDRVEYELLNRDLKHISEELKRISKETKGTNATLNELRKDYL